MELAISRAKSPGGGAVRVWEGCRKGIGKLTEIDPGLSKSVLCQDTHYDVRRTTDESHRGRHMLVGGAPGFRLYSAAV